MVVAMLHVVVLVSVAGTVAVVMEKHVLWTSVVVVGDVAVGPLLGCDSHHWKRQVVLSYVVVLVSLGSVVVFATDADADLNLVTPSQMVVLHYVWVVVGVLMDVAVAPVHMHEVGVVVAGMDAEVESNLVAPSHVVLDSVEGVVVVVKDADVAPACMHPRHEMLLLEVGEVATVVAKRMVEREMILSAAVESFQANQE